MFEGVALLVFMALNLVSEGAHWKYKGTGYGPQEWKMVSKHCSESAQSPININVRAAHKNPNLKGLSFTCENVFCKISGKLTNTGHGPTLSINKSKGTATLTEGPLGDSKYKLEQLHFHYGCDDCKGSEHTLDGFAFSGELHLVTYNTRYPDFKAAADKPDGLAVMAIFIQDWYDDGRNVALRKLSSRIRKISKADSAIQVQALFLYQLVPDLENLSGASFFSYKGSLTTPPCFQSVSWIVLIDPIDASKDDLKAMRHLHDYEDHPICDNFRPTQPLNGRTVSEYSD